VQEKDRLRATRLPMQHGRQKDSRSHHQLELSFKDRFYFDLGATGNKKETKVVSKELQLVLARGEEEAKAGAAESAVLIVGACSMTAPKSENEGKRSSSGQEGSFEVTLVKSKDTAFFSVSHTNGKLASGEQTELRFEFDREAYKKSLGVQTGGAGQLIDSSGHWVRCKATIALKGGAVSVGPSNQNIAVHLEVFIRDL
jgi:hypothetical protein